MILKILDSYRKHHPQVFLPAGGRALLLLLLYSLHLSAQSLRLYTNPAERPAIADALQDFRFQVIDNQFDTLTFLVPDTSNYAAVGAALLQHLRSNAYLTASLDSLRTVGPDAVARLYLGFPVRWVQLRPGTGDHAAWLEAAGYRARNFYEKPLRYDALLVLEQRVLEQAENHGYPFATVGLDSVTVTDDGGVSAILGVVPHQFVTFKGIKINGDVQLPAAFLPNYLGLRPGTAYSRARVLRFRDQLRTLLFVETTGNPSVTFAGQEATVNLICRKNAPAASISS